MPNPWRKLNWAVLISGTGSNLMALLDLEPILNVNLVVASKASAPGILKARRRGIPVHVFQDGDWGNLNEVLRDNRVDYIFLAGFMKILPESFVNQWVGRIFNIHPSLLPSYPGLKSIERAYNEGAPLGCTLHQVIPEIDAGQMILQKQSERGHNLASSEFQVHVNEHRTVRKGVEWRIRNQ